MNGEILKSKLLKIEPSLANIARRLNISPQSLSQALTASDIKTGFVEKLAIIYDRPISYFFESELNEKTQTQIGNGQQMGGSGMQQQQTTNTHEHDELIRLREETKFLKQQLSDRDSRIAELRTDNERLQNYLIGKK